jgi:type I restriction enzyme, R subunit
MEDQPSYGTQSREMPNCLDKVQSLLPALQLLMQMGWAYLTPEEADRLRGNRLERAILEPLLAAHIRDHCRFAFKGVAHSFTENAIQGAVQALQGFRATGAAHENEQAYDLLCLGMSVAQTIEGDTKSFPIHYIDWVNPAGNTFHCTAEFKVERSGSRKHYTPDIVLFVNGIPLAVMTCKLAAGALPRQDPIDPAIEHLARYQARDGVPQLFMFSQLLLALARDRAHYGTTGTPSQYWTTWNEAGLAGELRRTMDLPVNQAQLEKLLSEPFAEARGAFLSLTAQRREITAQDRTVYALCRPRRLLELVHKFTLFDVGSKKIARPQQYFTVQKVIQRVFGDGQAQTRAGGVVWHTHGSGRSLTMVMLAKSLAMHSSGADPKIILVSDRIDLDEQIRAAIRACGLAAHRATTGKHLIELLRDRRVHVVSVLRHKFLAALAKRELKQAHRNTFILVDEGHRNQSSEQHSRMRTALRDACFILFTGTPLAKSARENIFARFGDLVAPAYTIHRALKDKVVVPLLYEARQIAPAFDQTTLDVWFHQLTIGLTDDRRADLKRRFSTAAPLNKALRKARAIAWDVSLHYQSTCGRTGFKGQLVAPDKQAALDYKAFLDGFGMVVSEVLISAPETREGEDLQKSPSEAQRRFWQTMMDRFGSEKIYNQQLINAFKHGEHPEIIIVVDKLLTTGFDAPRNRVIYLTRRLKGPTLLQAIARVNRIHPGKQYGLILDYSGGIEALSPAVDFYGQLPEFDPHDLESTVIHVQDRIGRLPRMHAHLWELFGSDKETRDPEALQSHLRDAALRNHFYERFTLFARTLSLALSSATFLLATDEKTIQQYKADLRRFHDLRIAVGRLYWEKVDYADDEMDIKKLIALYSGADDMEDTAPQTAAAHTDEDSPEMFSSQDMARRYYGCVCESAPAYGGIDPEPATRIAKLIAERLAGHKVRDWRTNPDAINRMRGEIDDILFDMAEAAGIDLCLEDQDAIIERCIDVAIANED